MCKGCDLNVLDSYQESKLGNSFDFITYDRRAYLRDNSCAVLNVCISTMKSYKFYEEFSVVKQVPF